jgi:hypothetical protein
MQDNKRKRKREYRRKLTLCNLVTYIPLTEKTGETRKYTGERRKKARTAQNMRQTN